MSTYWQDLKLAIVAKLLGTMPLSTLEDLKRGSQKGPTAARKNLTHKARGRLVLIESSLTGAPQPLRHMLVELWDRDLGSPDDFLGDAYTDADGRFEIAYDPADAGLGDTPDLDLRVVDVTEHRDRTHKLVEERKLIHVVTGPDDCTVVDFDFGDCPVPWWPYSLDSPFARVASGDGVAENLPEDFGAARKSAGFKSIADMSSIRMRHLTTLAIRNVSIDQIMGDYPTNLTRELAKTEPGRTDSDEWLCERVMNGFFPCLFRKRTDGTMYVALEFGALETDDKHVKLDTIADFDIRDDKLRILRIHVNDPAGKRSAVYAPGDPQWLAAKRVFRTNYTAFGQVIAHLGRGHINIEQYAVAGFRQLRASPVAKLLIPHLREVVVINHRASTSLLGEDGFVVMGSALTAKSVVDALALGVSSADWAHWQPRLAVTPQHRFARVGSLYWETLGRWVDSFFTKNDVAIRENWREIHAFSDELVQHSLPFVRTKGAGDPWYDDREHRELDTLRVTLAGVQKAVSAVTRSDTADDEGIANLKQLCKYVLYHATFFHTWANDEQWNDGGDPRYSSLGLSGDVLANPGIDPVTPYEATTQLYFAYYLSHTRYGMLVRNEDGDVDEAFVELLKSERKAYEALGYDIDGMRARINI